MLLPAKLPQCPRSQVEIPITDVIPKAQATEAKQDNRKEKKISKMQRQSK
jgi:hypothetical protein